jgi:hypothetical protein
MTINLEQLNRANHHDTKPISSFDSYPHQYDRLHTAK